MEGVKPLEGERRLTTDEKKLEKKRNKAKYLRLKYLPE